MLGSSRAIMTLFDQCVHLMQCDQLTIHCTATSQWHDLTVMLMELAIEALAGRRPTARMTLFEKVSLCRATQLYLLLQVIVRATFFLGTDLLTFFFVLNKIWNIVYKKRCHRFFLFLSSRLVAMKQTSEVR